MVNTRVSTKKSSPKNILKNWEIVFIIFFVLNTFLINDLYVKNFIDKIQREKTYNNINDNIRGKKSEEKQITLVGFFFRGENPGISVLDRSRCEHTRIVPLVFAIPGPGFCKSWSTMPISYCLCSYDIYRYLKIYY